MRPDAEAFGPYRNVALTQRELQLLHWALGWLMESDIERAMVRPDDATLSPVQLAEVHLERKRRAATGRAAAEELRTYLAAALSDPVPVGVRHE